MKQKIINWFLAKEQEELILAKGAYREVIANLEAERADFKQYRENLSEVDLVRFQLKGFNHLLLDKAYIQSDGEIFTDIFEDAKVAGLSEKDLLNEIKSLTDNRALPVVFDHIKRNQLIYSAQAARSLSEMNFGRASINGVELVREEVGRLLGIHKERNAPEEEYDEHAVI